MNNRPFFTISTLFVFITLLLVNCSPANSQGSTGQLADDRPAKTPTAVPTSVYEDVVTAVFDTPHDLTAFPPQASVTITFNQPMQPDGTTTSLVISPTIGGIIHWNPQNTSFTFEPDPAFSVGQVYDLHINPALQSASGAAFADAPQWQLHTLTNPVVASLTPNDHTWQTLRPAYALTFDRPMDYESLVAALGVEPDLDLALTWHENTLYIEPTNPVQTEKLYQFTLAKTAVDLNGLSLAEDFTWAGRAPGAIDQKQYPTDRYDSLTVTFNYVIDPASVTLQFTPDVAGSTAWNEDFTALTFTPDTPLPAGASINVNFANTLQTADGELLTRPAPLRFYTDNPVGTVWPPDGNSIAALNSQLSVVFNQSMDTAKTAESFIITPTVAGEISWQGSTMMFTPENGRFAPNTTYTFRLDAAKVVDAHGYMVLEQSLTRTFTTNNVVHVVSFGSGEHTQVLNVNGRRAVQYAFSYQQDPTPVTFLLYRLNLEEWQAGGNGQFVSQWTDDPLPRTTDYLHTQETTLPSDLPAGIYRLDLQQNGYHEDSLFIFFSHNGLVLKHDGQKLWAWVAGFDGSLVSEAEIFVYRAGQLIGNDRTDATGFYQQELNIDSDNPIQLVARTGDDVTIVSSSSYWTAQWSGQSEPTHTIHISTDRPVYHPGQVVNFRAIIRQTENGSPVMLPAETPVTVSLINDNWETEQTINLLSSHFGTVNGQFELAEVITFELYEQPLFNGRYYIEVAIGDTSSRHTIEVVTDPSPDYTVQVMPAAPIYAVGDRIEVTVEGQDSNGQPIKDATVMLYIYEAGDSSDCFSSPSFSGTWYDSYRDPIRGRTDENGRFTTTIPAQFSYFSHNGMVEGSNTSHSVWAIAATVQVDEENSPAGFAVVEVSNTLEEVVVEAGSILKNVGQEFVVQATVQTMMGQPVNGRFLTATLTGYNAHNGVNDAATYQTNLTTGSNGRAQGSFTVSQPGQYELRVAGQDAWGNEFYTVQDLYIQDPTSTSFGGPSDFALIVDRASYAPGETARLIIRSAQSGSTLLTFSRGTLTTQQIVSLTPPLTVVDVPLTAADAPNLTVTAHTWYGRSDTFTAPGEMYQSIADDGLHIATAQVNVVDPSKILNVTITPHNEAVIPGQPMDVTVRVTNSLGEPVSAEFALSVVDNALFSQYSVHTAPLTAVFHTHRSSLATTYHSTVPSRYMVSDGFGGGCGCGGWGGPAGGLTQDFSDFSAWLPALVTDANGEATTTLTLPTAGAWRLTARAITADTQVGEAVSVITLP